MTHLQPIILLIVTLLLFPSATMAAESAPLGQTWKEPLTGMEFIWIEGGCFAMGCSSNWSTDCDEDEKPSHTVCVDNFYMAKYEVTQAQWRKVTGSNPAYFKKGDEYPVEKVSWDQSQEFIGLLDQKHQQLRFRLPTEAEWEFACRSGGKQENFCGGNEIDALAWHKKNSQGLSHPVGQKTPNGLGLYDMSGNVAEWTNDRYEAQYYANSPDDNPQGPTEPQARADRGGSWLFYPKSARSTNRNWYWPDGRRNFLGLRVLLELEKQTK